MYLCHYYKVTMLLVLVSKPQCVASQTIVQLFLQQNTINDTINRNTDANGQAVLYQAKISASTELFHIPHVEFTFMDSLTNNPIATEFFYKSTSSFRNLTNSNGSRSNETVWHGGMMTTSGEHVHASTKNSNNTIINDRIGFCTIYEESGRIRSGSFSTEQAAYDLIYLDHIRQYEIRSTLWRDFLPNDFVSNPKFIGDRSEPTSSSVLGSYISIKPARDSFDWIYEDGPALLKSSFTLKDRLDDDGTAASRATQNVTIDILILVSNSGMCEYAGVSAPCEATPQNIAPMQARIKIMVSQTNNALSTINVQIRVVQVIYMTNNNWNPRVNYASSGELYDSEEIKALRITYSADLVAVITTHQNATFCGLGYLKHFLSISDQSCLSSFTFSHEIGHNLGCYHDRKNCERSHEYAHGYRTNTYRTIMSYECTWSKCPAVPYYSSSTLKLRNGKSLGSPIHDNLRQILEFAPRVAAWSNAITPTCSTRCQNGTRNLMRRKLLFGLFCISVCVEQKNYNKKRWHGFKCGSC
jgi:Metallo-peptidase family M12B Reprolysin-like